MANCCFVSVAVTEILWRPRGLLVDQFDSKEDLINAVITSSFIPGYIFRNVLNLIIIYIYVIFQLNEV